MSKHIKEINSNVGGEFSYQLGPKTLVVAPNMGGKTRLVNAVSLAVRGEGVSIRKKEVELMVFKPEADKELWVDAEMSDGETVTWHAEGSTAKASKAKWSRDEPVGTMVFEAANNVLSASPEKLRQAILNSLRVVIQKEDIYQKLVSDLWPIVDKHWPVGKDVLEIDEFGEVLEAISSQLRTVSKQLKAITGDVDSSESMTAAEEEEYGRLLDQKAVASITSEQMESMRSQVDSLTTEIETVRARLEKSNQTADTSALHLVTSATSAAKALLEVTEARGKTEFKCQLCGSQTNRDALLGRLELLAVAHGKLESQAKAVQAREEDKRQLAYLRGQLDQLRNRVQMAVVAEPVNTGRLEALRKKHDAAEQLKGLFRYKAKLTQEEGDLKSVKKVLKEQEDTTLTQNEQTFSERVSQFLPLGEKAQVTLREGRRKVCRIYLTSGRGTVELRALSGAESAILVSAVSSALYQDGDFRLLVIDDRWFDPVRMQDLIASIDSSMKDDSKGPTQAIVCAAQWDGPFPSDWTTLDLRKGR